MSAIEEREKVSAGTGGRRALLRVAAMAPLRRRRLSVAIALTALTMMASIGLLAASGYLIVWAAERPGVLELTPVIVAVRFFGTSRSVLRYLERLVAHDLAFRQLADLRRRFFAALAPRMPASLPSLRSGDLLSRFVGDVDKLQDLYLRVLIPPLAAVIVILAAGITTGLVLPQAAAVLVVCLLLAATVVPVATALVARAAGRRQAAARARLTGELVESLDGAAELALLGQTQMRLKRLAAADSELAVLARRDAIAGGLATGLGSLISGLALVGVIAAAVPATADGAIRGPYLGLLALVVLAAFEAVAQLPTAAQNLTACASAAQRLTDVLDSPVVVSDRADPVRLAVDAAPSLRTRAMTLIGDPGGFQPHPILDRIDFELAAGQAVVLVGASGAGKTTLAELLVRFRDPTAGTVELAGIDVRGLAQEELRRWVLLCAQDAHMFTTSIAANLRLARPEATDDDLRAALAAVDLDRFVDHLPDGIDTLVGQDGAQLSGGQRRRLLVARGLVSAVPLVLFDEPAGHLSSDGAQALHRRLAAERERGRGVLVIAHVLIGLEDYDQILVLHGGQIVERGTHAELLSTGGRYARMALEQAAALGSAR